MAPYLALELRSPLGFAYYFVYNTNGYGEYFQTPHTTGNPYKRVAYDRQTTSRYRPYHNCQREIKHEHVSHPPTPVVLVASAAGAVLASSDATATAAVVLSSDVVVTSCVTVTSSGLTQSSAVNHASSAIPVSSVFPVSCITHASTTIPLYATDASITTAVITATATAIVLNASTASTTSIVSGVANRILPICVVSLGRHSKTQQVFADTLCIYMGP